MTLRLRATVALLFVSSSITPVSAQNASPPHGDGGRSAVPAALVQSLPPVEIKFEKVVMPNGLTLIVHEDRKVPVVSVATYYHVGSANETPGRTGFAHLFEHLMFNGSEHANDDWFKFMNEIGATEMNGTTGNDRTNYYQTVPKSGLDRVLWYESDRMRNLLPAIDQAKLDEQRNVVLNEKRQRSNNPLGALPDMLYAAIYPKGHPYSWTPIGATEDLNAASLDDVKSFFKTWYGAGNAVLVLAGDITLAEAREKVQKYYGSIPAGPAIQRPIEQPVPMAGRTRGRLEAQVATPMLVRAWNVPGWSSHDLPLLSLAASALSSGETSVLQRRLVREQQVASEVDAQVNGLELGSQVIVSATARPGVSLAQLEAAVETEMSNFLRDGMSAEELDRIKFQRYSSAVRSQSSTSFKAQRLAEGELYAGDPGFYQTRQTIINAATRETVLETARKWLSNGSYTIEVAPLPAHEIAQEDVDRTTKPPLEAPTPFSLPPLRHATLSNGIKVMLAERRDMPIVNMSLIFDVGSLPERTLESAGLSAAMGLAGSATSTYSPIQLAARLQELGASVQWRSDREKTRLTMSALKIKLDETLDLYADVLFNPAFPEDEWDRNRAIFKSSFEQNLKSPQGKLSLIYSRFIYGDGHPYSAVMTPDIADKLTVEQFRAYYQKWIRPDSATVLIVGDTSLAEMLPKLEERLAGWKAVGQAPVKSAMPEVVRATKPRIVLVDEPNAESSIVTLAGVGPARTSPDFEMLNVANTVLGGGFLSRLNMNLREEKGWSYGATSKLESDPLIGAMAVGTVVQTDKTAAAMSEINREIREISTSRRPSPQEIEVAKNAMLLGLTTQLQDPTSAYRLYYDAYRFDFPEDYWNSYVASIQAFTPDQIGQAATQLYHPNEVTWFVVGDLSKIEAEVRKLNLGEVMVYSADGNRVR